MGSFLRDRQVPGALLLAALALLLGAPAVIWAQAEAVAPEPEESNSEPQLVDRIVAIVDEEMILQSDLEREMELYHLERNTAGLAIEATDEEIRDEILQRLMESKLIIAAAKQADIRVENEVIRESVDEKIEQLVEHLGSRDALERELLRSGMTLVDYRSRLAMQIQDRQYLLAVVNRFIRPKIEVLENEITEYYAEHADEIPATPDSLTLANILIPIQPSLAVRQAVQEKVTIALQALQAGQPFAEVARTHSAGPNASRGGTIGILKAGDLFDTNLDATAFALAEGETSQPVVTQRGVHILHVEKITPEGRAISQIFFPMEVTKVDVDAARVEAGRAHGRILAGEPFALIASEMSGDPVSSRNGGELGTFRLQDLSPQFQEALQEQEAGSLTEPLLTPAGFYIFLVKARKAGRKIAFEEVKDEIRRALESQKLEEELARYVEKLRSRFFIDLKS